MAVETVGGQYRFQECWGQAGQQLVYGTRDSFQHWQGLASGGVALQQAGQVMYEGRCSGLLPINPLHGTGTCPLQDNGFSISMADAWRQGLGVGRPTWLAVSADSEEVLIKLHLLGARPNILHHQDL